MSETTMDDLQVNPDQWVKLLTGDDLQCMLAVGVLTYILFRLKVAEWLCFVAPVIAGGVWGMWNAVDQQWAFGAHILKGFYVNGGGAALAAFAVHKAMDRLFGVKQNVGVAVSETLLALLWFTVCATVFGILLTLFLSACGGADDHDYHDCVFAGEYSSCCYTDCNAAKTECTTVCD